MVSSVGIFLALSAFSTASPIWEYSCWLLMMLISGGFSRTIPPVLRRERNSTRRSGAFRYNILGGVGGMLSVGLNGTRKVLYSGRLLVCAAVAVGPMYMRSMGLSNTDGFSGWVFESRASQYRLRSDCRSVSAWSGASFRMRVGVKNEVSVDLEHWDG